MFRVIGENNFTLYCDLELLKCQIVELYLSMQYIESKSWVFAFVFVAVITSYSYIYYAKVKHNKSTSYLPVYIWMCIGVIFFKKNIH